MSVLTRGLWLLTVSLMVSSCSGYSMSNKTALNGDQSNPEANMTATKLAAGAPLAGDLASAMDANDKEKLSKALDAALGKPSSWKNPINDIAYTVTPIQKAKVAGNKICRSYTVQADNKGRIEQIRGIACIGDKGTWQVTG